MARRKPNAGTAAQAFTQMCEERKFSQKKEAEARRVCGGGCDRMNLIHVGRFNKGN